MAIKTCIYNNVEDIFNIIDDIKELISESDDKEQFIKELNDYIKDDKPDFINNLIKVTKNLCDKLEKENCDIYSCINDFSFINLVLYYIPINLFSEINNVTFNTFKDHYYIAGTRLNTIITNKMESFKINVIKQRSYEEMSKEELIDILNNQNKNKK